MGSGVDCDEQGGLCRRLGHDCDDPGAGSVRANWWGYGEEPLAVAHLLECRLPAAVNGGGPAWRVALAQGQAPEPEQGAGTWSPAPTAADVLAAGGYPMVFVGAGDVGRRYPVAVGFLAEGIVDDEGTDTGRPTRGRAAALVARSLTDLLAPSADPQGEGVRLLIDDLAERLTRWCHDLLRITVAREPGGDPVDDELHLLLRDVKGGTRRLAVARAPSARDAGRYADPACVLAGHVDSSHAPTPEAHRTASRRTRAACTAALLSEFLHLNNNDRVRFAVAVQSHGLPVTAEAEADAAFRAWLPTTGLWRDLWSELGLEAEDFAEEVAAGKHGLERVESRGLAARFADFSGDGDPAQAFQFAGAESAERLGPLLLHDLFDSVAEQVADRPGGAPLFGYAVDLPFEWSGDDYGAVVLVGPSRVALITIDACV